MKRLDQPEKTWNKKIVNSVDIFLENINKKFNNTDMKTENETYRGISFKASFIVVAILHVIAFYFMFAFDVKKANAVDNDKQFLKNEKYVGVSDVNRPISENSINTQSVEPIKPKVEIIYYTIGKGDTLYSIAKKNSISLNRLQKLNKIKDANKIYVGQKLVLN